MLTNRKAGVMMLSGILALSGLAGCAGQAGSVKPEATQEVSSEADAGDEAQERKARSMGIVAGRGIKVMEALPLIETEAECSFQTPEDVARRAVCLMVVALYSEYMINPEVAGTVEEAKEFIAPVIEQYGVANDFSAAEKSYLDSDSPTEQEMINYSWQYENLGVMLWALGLMDELDFPDEIVDVGLTVQRINQFDTLEALVEGSSLKSPAEILDAADLIFRLDWACVDARLNGRQAPGGLDAGVVKERHKSLNWLIRKGENWDEIDTST